LAVYNGEADAAGVGTAVFQQPEISHRIDIRQLRILAESRSIPHLPVAVRSDMDVKLALHIQQMLIGLAHRPEGQAILKKMGIERFEAADDNQYRLVRNLLEEEADAH
jgi:phosphonate transport system substrate-binding protein